MDSHAIAADRKMSIENVCISVRARPFQTHSNPTGKIVLIDRGACAISLKIDAAAAAGAIGVLIGLVAPGDAISFSMAGGSHFVPTLVITQNVSSRIKNALASSTVNGTISVKNASFSALCGPG
jgi:hypothetical protein